MGCCFSTTSRAHKFEPGPFSYLYTYDSLGRPATKAAPNLPTVTTVYNDFGDVIQISNPVLGGYSAHTLGYDYDAAGRRRYERVDGREIGYLYDQAGNRSRTTWPDGYYVSYTYDAANRMDQVRENGGTLLADYTHDALSRRSSLQLGGSATNAVTYTYEPDSALDVLGHQLNTATLTYNYGYNGSNQISSLSLSDDFYLGDPPSNDSYARNALNQYTSVDGQSASYDDNGNLTSWLSPDKGRQTYTYDAENRSYIPHISSVISAEFPRGLNVATRRLGAGLQAA